LFTERQESGVQRWNKPPHCWVTRGRGERFGRVEQFEHRLQMLLGVFSAKGVFPPEFKPAHSVGDLLRQEHDTLEQETERKGGLGRALEDHFACLFNMLWVSLRAQG
jgi:hypothetical protein